METKQEPSAVWSQTASSDSGSDAQVCQTFPQSSCEAQKDFIKKFIDYELIELTYELHL